MGALGARGRWEPTRVPTIAHAISGAVQALRPKRTVPCGISPERTQAIRTAKGTACHWLPEWSVAGNEKRGSTRPAQMEED